jgi:hypothetical protein
MFFKISNHLIYNYSQQSLVSPKKNISKMYIFAVVGVTSKKLLCVIYRFWSERGMVRVWSQHGMVLFTKLHCIYPYHRKVINPVIGRLIEFCAILTVRPAIDRFACHHTTWSYLPFSFFFSGALHDVLRSSQTLD